MQLYNNFYKLPEYVEKKRTTLAKLLTPALPYEAPLWTKVKSTAKMHVKTLKLTNFFNEK